VKKIITALVVPTHASLANPERYRGRGNQRARAVRLENLRTVQHARNVLMAKRLGIELKKAKIVSTVQM
tara:strand:- start:3113 stop:3319 length:207 start_codon:yes stop_codon:yes gene_type:complete